MNCPVCDKEATHMVLSPSGEPMGFICRDCKRCWRVTPAAVVKAIEKPAVTIPGWSEQQKRDAVCDALTTIHRHRNEGFVPVCIVSIKPEGSEGEVSLTGTGGMKARDLFQLLRVLVERADSGKGGVQ